MRRIDKNARRSRAIVAGNIAYLGGQVANDWDAEITQQTRETLENIDALLAEAGTSREKIVSATIWLSEMANYDAMNKVWDAWVDLESPPTRACGQVRLADDRLLVEIVVTAVI